MEQCKSLTWMFSGTPFSNVPVVQVPRLGVFSTVYSLSISSVSRHWSKFLTTENVKHAVQWEAYRLTVQRIGRCYCLQGRTVFTVPLTFESDARVGFFLRRWERSPKLCCKLVNITTNWADMITAVNMRHKLHILTVFFCSMITLKPWLMPTWWVECWSRNLKVFCLDT